jgi:signal transduction histidine kinase
MIIAALSALCAALAAAAAAQYRARRKLERDIRYIADKLNETAADGSAQKILLHTDLTALRDLLTGINLLQEERQRESAGYARTGMAMRRMLSNISHDLRTPLTVISGYVEMMTHRSDISPDERAVLMGKLSAKVREVIGMINAFFDLARLESGDKELPLSRVRLDEVCRRNILAFYDVLTDNGFDVEIDIPDEPIHVLANEEALDRVLNNLISNAIRYGGDGRMLGLAVRVDDEAACVDVTDRGKGIQEAHQDHIFERLYTLEDSRNRKYQGSGLGLTITKRLVELMHGSISVASKPWERTTFTVRLKRMNQGGGQA